MRIVLAAWAIVAAQAAWGSAVAEPIAIGNIVPYAEPSAPGAYLGVCDWNEKLPQAIVAASGGRVVATRSHLATRPGPVLVLTVAQMRVGSGGNWTGKQSWILLHGELREGGRLIDSVDFRRGWTKSWSGCHAARKIGKLLAADVAGWVRTRAASPPSTGN